MPVNPNDRINPETLQLSGAQLDYVRDRDLEGWQYEEDDDKVIESVEAVADNLGDRFLYLVEDLSLLHDEQFLDFEYREGISDEIEDIDAPQPLWDQFEEFHLPRPGSEESPPNPRRRQDRLYKPPIVFEGPYQDDISFMEFGVNLGHIAYFVNENSDEDIDHSMVASGFLMGMTGRWLEDLHGIDEVGLWLKRLKGTLTEAIENIERAQTSLIDSVDSKTEEIAISDEIEDRLVKSGYEPVLPLKVEVYSRIEPLISEDIGDTSFIQPETVEEINIADVIWPSIADLKASDTTDKVAEFTEMVVEDIEMLSNKSWRTDLCEIDVLSAHWMAEKRLIENSPSNIHVFLNARWNPTVGKHMKDLAGKGSNPEPWVDHPLVQGSPRNYELTSYGELLGYMITPRRLSELNYTILDSTSARTDLKLFREEEGIASKPSKSEILSICYSFAFGHIQTESNPETLFERAFEQRTQIDTDND